MHGRRPKDIRERRETMLYLLNDPLLDPESVQDPNRPLAYRGAEDVAGAESQEGREDTDGEGGIRHTTPKGEVG